ncbi:MAG: tyrosine-type recombinase/integrase [Clostridiales bacterium]|nr:tyrosine-type recombinase/integrase [Clostridiales bacterium]
MIKIHNKSSKPDNIVTKEHHTVEKIMKIERVLPYFMKDYFTYLKGAVSLNSRYAYLNDIKFFCEYLINNTDKINGDSIDKISLDDFNSLKARDINTFLGDYCTRYYKDSGISMTVYENNNRALSRKKSALSSLFKFLYRNEQINSNIVEGLNPIKLPKPQPDAIKRLYVEELNSLLNIVKTGDGLSESEKKYWDKTKLRDKAIILLFTTYGLRLKELQELNISSFNFTRKEFVIFRKRSKESIMPLNKSVENSIKDYIENERSKYSDDEDALFISIQNKRLSERSIRQLVKKYTSIALDKPRSNGYSPHKLRATAASTLIEFGFSIYDVQNLLDHDNITTTQLYSAHKKNSKRDIIINYELDPSKDKS